MDAPASNASWVLSTCSETVIGKARIIGFGWNRSCDRDTDNARIGHRRSPFFLYLPSWCSQRQERRPTVQVAKLTEKQIFTGTKWLCAFFVFVTCLSLAACNSPRVELWDNEKIIRDVGGHDILLFRQGDLLEVFDTAGGWPLSRFAEMSAKASQVAKSETGCAVHWVDGDTAAIRIGLACEGRQPPPKPEPRRFMVCDIVLERPELSACELNLAPKCTNILWKTQCVPRHRGIFH